jgi:tetratricopeptide (TPR) repeat protein
MLHSVPRQQGIELLRVLSFSVLLVFAFDCFGQASPSRDAEVKKHLQLGEQFLKQQNAAEAAREFHIVLGLDPKNVPARANLGVLDFFRGDCAAALPEFRAALKVDEKLWNIYALLGFCEIRQGDTAEAQRNFERSFPKLIDPKLRVQVGLFLVDVYRQSGDVDRATATIIRLQAQDGENVDVQYAAYRLYSDLADQAITAVSVNHGDSARMQQIVAQRLIETGNLEGAIRAYREALRIDSQLTGVHFELGEALLRHGGPDLSEAQKEFEAAIAENPNDAESEYHLGEISLRNSDKNGAYEHFSRALRIQPQNPDGHFGMGKLDLLSGKPEEALAELEKVVAADPANADAHYSLIQVYRKLGRTDEAERELKVFEALRASQRQLQEAFGRSRYGDTPSQPDPASPKAQ